MDGVRARAGGTVSAPKAALVGMMPDVVFAHDGLEVVRVGHALAEAACAEWHYSRKCPMDRHRYAFFDGGRLDGVIVFRGAGTNPATVEEWWRRWSERPVELTRIALRPQAERGWPTTKYIRFAVRALREDDPAVDLVYSYSDPRAGHEGTVYLAANFSRFGTSNPRRAYVDERGVMLGTRTIDDRRKRTMDRRRGEVAPIDVPGKHRFGLPLTRSARRALAG